MSGHHIQPSARDTAVDVFQDGPSSQDWGGGQDTGPQASSPKLGRYLAAINRFKWLIALFVMLGAGGGYAASKMVTPEYEVNATIILEMGMGTNQDRSGPIQAAGLLEASGWQDLLRSYAVADPVVNELSLFVSPSRAADSTLFKSFRVVQGAVPGDYTLTVNGTQYSLALNLRGEVEKGALGDSIGRSVGFTWAPGAQAFAGKSEVEFRVQTVREASTALIKKLQMELNPGSSFLKLVLRGDDPARTAATLNAWVVQFVAKATELKKMNVMSYARILEGQRVYASSNLTAAENALLRFSVSTATEPSERQSAIAGVDRTTNPAFDAYFRDKIIAENYKHDRESIERLLDPSRSSTGLTREALLSIPIVASDAAAEDLRNILKEQSDREFNLRRLRESYTDEYQKVKDELAALATLRTVTVPRAVNAFLTQLKLRENMLNETIALTGIDLRAIPNRTIEEQRLKRQVDVAAELYRSLDLKAAEAKLAEAATIPDVTVSDSAVAPLRPTRNTASVIILGAVGAALALGIVLAILLDQVDKRFRYPEQATEDLGLFILGVVPIVSNRKKRSSTDHAAQVVEAFRTIRMNVRYAADPGRPLTMTITSPGPNDGKSLISSNLALSFAESGARTLLIDGDIRRGELAKVFGTTQRPGLVEYLDGTALIAEVLHPTNSHPNLTVMPAGARRRRAPELLATPRLSQLIHQMAAEYDVVIVDSPPLGAGFDAYALATATGNLALVMRAGLTDRKMAAAKMATVDTLPVRVMGAVLNGIKLTGAYQYYSYYQDYAAEDETQPARIASGKAAEKALQNASRDQ
jgi:capsular exopolysaccharide synthesis family protein